VLRDLPDTAATVLLIGHNPGAQDLVALLSGQQVGLDTCSIAVLAWTGSWSDDPPTAALQQHATPR
jgi:phosphohistidine phosphatase